MAVKKIAYDQEARERIKVTLGPSRPQRRPREVLRRPTVTKDGVTVAKEIELEDKYENMGAQMVKEVASKTSDVAGDGTTTATIYAEAIFDEGLKNVTAGANPMEIKRGIDKAVAAVVEPSSRSMSKPRQGQEGDRPGRHHLRQPGRRDRQDHRRGHGEGRQGRRHHRRRRQVLETDRRRRRGHAVRQGLPLPHFVTDTERMEASSRTPTSSSTRRRSPTSRTCSRSSSKIAESGKPAAHHRRGHRGRGPGHPRRQQAPRHPQGRAVKAPGFGDRRKAMLEDIAILTGGQAIMEELGIKLEKLDLKDLGRPRRSPSTRTTPPSSRAPARRPTSRAASSRSAARSRTSTSDYDREKLQERLAKLAGGVAQINVGAATEVEMKEKKARVEDALHATRAAVEEGILPGGGVALLRARKALDKPAKKATTSARHDIVHRAVSAPIKQIAANAGSTARRRQQGRGEPKPTSATTPPPTSTATSSKAGVIDPHQGRPHRPAERRLIAGLPPHHRLLSPPHSTDPARSPKNPASDSGFRPREARSLLQAAGLFSMRGAPLQLSCPAATPRPPTRPGRHARAAARRRPRLPRATETLEHSEPLTPLPAPGFELLSTPRSIELVHVSEEHREGLCADGHGTAHESVEELCEGSLPQRV
jgi:chaperonin GroEL